MKKLMALLIFLFFQSLISAQDETETCSEMQAKILDNFIEVGFAYIHPKASNLVRLRIFEDFPNNEYHLIILNKQDQSHCYCSVPKKNLNSFKMHIGYAEEVDEAYNMYIKKYKCCK